MPTSGRLIYDGAICHIIQRGNNRQKIFRREVDYTKFLSLCMEYKAKYDYNLYNYCLMSNHVHLLIRIGLGDDLARLMQGIFQSFRFYYRREYKYTGYLFQGRYKSKLIEKDGYLLECARYIERNPLRAGIVKDMADYKWSSFLFYAFDNKNDIITTNPVFSTLGNTHDDRQLAYRQHISEDRLYEELIDKEFKIK